MKTTSDTGRGSLLLYRLGVAGMVVSVACVAWGVLSVYHLRYVLGDLFDALDWQPPSWAGLALALVWLVSSLGGPLLLYISRRREPWPVKLLELLMMVSVIVAIFHPMFMKAPRMPRERRQSCTGYQRHLATSMMMYAQDHEGRLPEHWEDIRPYAGDLDAFLVDPQTVRYFHKRGGYGYNAHLRGRSIEAIPDPRAIPLTADGARPTSYLVNEHDIDRCRHGRADQRGCIITFVDGSATFLPADAPVSLTLEERENSR